MVVFFDIDGTLIDDRSQQIPVSTVRAVEKLRENGHIPVVNTGRPYAHIDPRVRGMAFSGFICGCGMEVRFGDRWISRQQPDLDLCRYVRQAVMDCNMQVMFEQREGAILTLGKWSSHPGCLWEAQHHRDRGYPVKELDSLPEPQFMKFVTLDGEKDCRRQEFLNRMEPYFTYIVRRHTLVEYMGKGCSKAGGMELLLKDLGLPREETLAIGDSANDLPMFRAAAHAMCMGNGDPEARAEAEYITDSVMENGIEKGLRHYGLI